MERSDIHGESTRMSRADDMDWQHSRSRNQRYGSLHLHYRYVFAAFGYIVPSTVKLLIIAQGMGTYFAC